MRNGYSAYMQDDVLSADPLRLVQLLYRGAIEAVSSAIASHGAGEIAARSRAVTKAVEIVGELSSSLDHARGGEISRNLAALYDYIQRRLIAANVEQRSEPLCEARSLLGTLAEAWATPEMPCAPGPMLAKAAAERAVYAW